MINLGFGGSTLAACVYFFERLVPPHHPRSLVFYAGDNDLGDGQAPEAVVESFQALLQKVTQQLGDTKLMFMSIKPSPARWPIIDQIRRTNMAIMEALATRPHSYYIDVFHPMLGDDGRPQPLLYSEDGLHLSPAGYRLWTQILTVHRSVIF